MALPAQKPGDKPSGLLDAYRLSGLAWLLLVN
jgi:hypothetical protein